MARRRNPVWAARASGSGGAYLSGEWEDDEKLGELFRAIFRAKYQATRTEEGEPLPVPFAAFPRFPHGEEVEDWPPKDIDRLRYVPRPPGATRPTRERLPENYRLELIVPHPDHVNDFRGAWPMFLAAGLAISRATRNAVRPMGTLHLLGKADGTLRPVQFDVREYVRIDYLSFASPSNPFAHDPDADQTELVKRVVEAFGRGGLLTDSTVVEWLWTPWLLLDELEDLAAAGRISEASTPPDVDAAISEYETLRRAGLATALGSRYSPREIRLNWSRWREFSERTTLGAAADFTNW